MLGHVLAQVGTFLNGGGYCCCSAETREDGGDIVALAECRKDGPGIFAGQFAEPIFSEPAVVHEASRKLGPGRPSIEELQISRASAGSLSCDLSPRACSSDDPGTGHVVELPFSVGVDVENPEELELKDMLKQFVLEALRGKPCIVVVEEGRRVLGELWLTENLRALRLKLKGRTHEIQISDLKDISPGRALENRFTPIPLDDLCSTLVLRRNECLTLRHRGIQERDDFIRCLRCLRVACYRVGSQLGWEFREPAKNFRYADRPGDDEWSKALARRKAELAKEHSSSWLLA